MTRSIKRTITLRKKEKEGMVSFVLNKRPYDREMKTSNKESGEEGKTERINLVENGNSYN